MVWVAERLRRAPAAARSAPWARIQETLRPAVRADEGRNPTPSAAIIDSQSVQTPETGGPGAMTPASR